MAPHSSMGSAGGEAAEAVGGVVAAAAPGRSRAVAGRRFCSRGRSRRRRSGARQSGGVAAAWVLRRCAKCSLTCPRRRRTSRPVGAPGGSLLWTRRKP